MSGAVWIDALADRVLRPYQLPHLQSILSQPMTLQVGARQIGKSFVLGAAAVVLAAYGVDGPPHDVLIISAKPETAANLIRSVRRHLKALAIVHDVADPRYPGLERIALANGRYIQAHPGPEALQGFTGSVFADEWSILAERHDPEEVLAQILSVSSAEPYYRVALCSNADHSGSWLHRMIAGEDERASEIATSLVTIHDAYPDGLPAKLRLIQRTMTARQWSKWFECAFLPSGDGAFSADAITESGRRFAHSGPVVRVACVDPGFTRHVTGWALCDVSEGRVDVVDGGHMYGDEGAIADLVRSLCDLGSGRLDGARRVYLDPGGPAFLLNRALLAEGLPVVPVSVNATRLEHWGNRLERMIEHGRLRVAPRAVRDDLTYIERDGDGYSLLERPSTQRGRVVHCDAGVAALMALQAPESVSGTGRLHTGSTYMSSTDRLLQRITMGVR